MAVQAADVDFGADALGWILEEGATSAGFRLSADVVVCANEGFGRGFCKLGCGRLVG